MSENAEKMRVGVGICVQLQTASVLLLKAMKAVGERSNKSLIPRSPFLIANCAGSQVFCFLTTSDTDSAR